MPQLQLPSGHDWAFVDANKDGRTTLLCLHGFPDLSYGYRHQIGPWARAGFRVVVPDMLGYGGSDAPVDPAQYTTKRLAADLAALLTALGVKQAVVIGHDWGSFIAGRFALWHPDRVLGLVLMSVPYTPPGRNLLSLEHAVERAPNLGYQLYLASPAAAPTIEANLPYFIANTFAPPYAPVDFSPRGALPALLAAAPPPAAVAELPSVLTKAERALYCAAFRARGMTGPTNYYRTTRLRATEEAEAAAAASTSPPGPSDDQLAHAIELTREAVQLDYQPAVKVYEGRSAALLGEVVRGEPHPPPRSAMRADRLQGIQQQETCTDRLEILRIIQDGPSESPSASAAAEDTRHPSPASASDISSFMSPPPLPRSQNATTAPAPALALPPVPVLSVHGTRDATIAPTALAAQRRAIPPPRLAERVFQCAGHWVLVEGVDAAAECVDVGVGVGMQDAADPLAGWRAAVSAGAWRDGTGDGGAVGRAVVEWLKAVKISAGRPRARL